MLKITLQIFLQILYYYLIFRLTVSTLRFNTALVQFSMKTSNSQFLQGKTPNTCTVIHQYITDGVFKCKRMFMCVVNERLTIWLILFHVKKSLCCSVMHFGD